MAECWLEHASNVLIQQILRVPRIAEIHQEGQNQGYTLVWMDGPHLLHS